MSTLFLFSSSFTKSVYEASILRNVKKLLDCTSYDFHHQHAGMRQHEQADPDELYSPCSLRRTSAARSPMMTQGAMVLPVVTRGMIEPSATRRWVTP